MARQGRNTVVPHDTEDRGWWYVHGEQLEVSFVTLCQERLNLDALINPAKDLDSTAPDLVVEGVLADLKTQNTPFFTAGRYGLDPRFTVTFNRKDYERYKALYPGIVIYFWIDWKQTTWGNNSVDYFGGVFRLPFERVAALIDGGAKEHAYINRTSPDDRNAKSSFLLDIRNFESLFVSYNRADVSGG
mgnify:CR=1 FL=1